MIQSILKKKYQNHAKTTSSCTVCESASATRGPNHIHKDHNMRKAKSTTSHVTIFDPTTKLPTEMLDMSTFQNSIVARIRNLGTCKCAVWQFRLITHRDYFLKSSSTTSLANYYSTTLTPRHEKRTGNVQEMMNIHFGYTCQGSAVHIKDSACSFCVPYL